MSDKTSENVGNGAPTTDRFNYARAMFRSIKRQRLEVFEPESSSKNAENEKAPSPEAEAKPDETNDQEQELRRKAVEKLKQEAVRSAERAKTMGAQGWVKPNSLRTNKHFLNRIVQSTKTKFDTKSCKKR